MRERRPGVWELRVYTGRDPATGRERQVSRTFHGGRRAAQTALSRLVADHGGETSAPTDAALSRLIEDWWLLREPELSPTTAREYRRLIDRRILPRWGDVPVSKITVAGLEHWYRQLVDDGLSPGSVRQIHSIVRVAFTAAVRWGWVASNPASHARPPQARPPEIRPPTIDQVRAILAAVDDPLLALALRVKVASGMRRGEVCGLRWCDVTGRRLDVRVNVVDVAGRTTVKDPKSHQQRRFTIDQGTADLLTVHRAAAVEHATASHVTLPDTGFVFSRWPDGSQPLRPETLSAAFKNAARTVGVEARLHDLRHSNATVLLDGGIPVKTVQSRLGHQTATTTLDFYGHAVDASDLAASDLIGQALDD